MEFITAGLSIETFTVCQYINLVVSVARRNPNLTIIFSFLHKIKEILVDYFRELEEESIRDNFVLIYELLDEIMDHGYPQTTDTKILKEFIKTASNKVSKKEEKIGNQNDISKTITGMAIRPPNIKYKVNKAFLDVVEKVNSMVNKI